MGSFAAGRISYVMTLVWTVVAWQVCSVGYILSTMAIAAAIVIVPLGFLFFIFGLVVNFIQVIVLYNVYVILFFLWGVWV
ncbi:hypothetical protein PHJA_000809100 [Phtheirospermum japonicum]|uniref:Transmembrane protein n=1 Tax=Phtheirospermum japonicum TaxID=374723 RepID=A0A830BRC4_9LAMI|nr:hypothetical protein PHJA_000809100 [Phtheirospermum japonicum]